MLSKSNLTLSWSFKIQTWAGIGLRSWLLQEIHPQRPAAGSWVPENLNKKTWPCLRHRHGILFSFMGTMESICQHVCSDFLLVFILRNLSRFIRSRFSTCRFIRPTRVVSTFLSMLATLAFFLRWLFLDLFGWFAFGFFLFLFLLWFVRFSTSILIIFIIFVSLARPKCYQLWIILFRLFFGCWTFHTWLLLYRIVFFRFLIHWNWAITPRTARLDLTSLQ